MSRRNDAAVVNVILERFTVHICSKWIQRWVPRANHPTVTLDSEVNQFTQLQFGYFAKGEEAKRQFFEPKGPSSYAYLLQKVVNEYADQENLRVSGAAGRAVPRWASETTNP
jgi:hypothetical protein